MPVYGAREEQHKQCQPARESERKSESETDIKHAGDKCMCLEMNKFLVLPHFCVSHCQKT